MTDIVERLEAREVLREYKDGSRIVRGPAPIQIEAASEIIRLRARVAELEQLHWRSIETVPKGVLVLLFCPPWSENDGQSAIFHGVFSGVCDEGCKEFCAINPHDKEAGGIDLYNNPTHWMPPPNPPENHQKKPDQMLCKVLEQEDCNDPR